MKSPTFLDRFKVPLACRNWLSVWNWLTKMKWFVTNALKPSVQLPKMNAVRFWRNTSKTLLELSKKVAKLLLTCANMKTAQNFNMPMAYVNWNRKMFKKVFWFSENILLLKRNSLFHLTGAEVVSLVGSWISALRAPGGWTGRKSSRWTHSLQLWELKTDGAAELHTKTKSYLTLSNGLFHLSCQQDVEINYFDFLFCAH